MTNLTKAFIGMAVMVAILIGIVLHAVSGYMNSPYVSFTANTGNCVMYKGKLPAQYPASVSGLAQFKKEQPLVADYYMSNPEQGFCGTVPNKG